jgi:hypothetical protein
MVTKEEVLKVMQGPKDGWTRWFTALPPTEYVNLARVLRELKSGPMGCMPQSAIDDLAKAVPDTLVRDIVNDNRKGPSVPGWLPPEKPGEPVKNTGGWVKPNELGTPSGTKYIDQMCDVQDAIDRRELERKLGGAR